MERMIVLLNKGFCVLLCFLLLIPTFFGGGGWAYATEVEGTPEEVFSSEHVRMKEFLGKFHQGLA